MSATEFLLVFLSISYVVGTPAYIFFRNRMGKKKGNTHPIRFPKAKVFKVTAINILLVILVSTNFFALLLSVLLRGFLPTPGIVLAISLFVATTCMAFYGSGIYTTSIVLEGYTLPELRDIKAFKTQFIATHLFHGPISHILIYSGFQFGLLALSYLDTVIPIRHRLTTPILLLAALGTLLGFIFALSQIYNRTHPYQLISGIICLSGLAILMAMQTGVIFREPLFIFSLGFFISFCLSLSMYIVGRMYFYKEKVDWDASGY